MSAAAARFSSTSWSQAKVRSSTDPSAGATTGTVMKTAMITETVRAIVAPTKRSRTIATVRTRPVAAPSPQTKRATSRSVNEGATIVSAAPTV